MDVALVPVTEENVRAVCELRVADSHTGSVAPPAFTVGARRLDVARRPGVAWPAMGAIANRVRGTLDRLASRRAERRAERGGRAQKRNAAKARRLSHERMDNKLPR